MYVYVFTAYALTYLCVCVCVKMRFSYCCVRRPTDYVNNGSPTMRCCGLCYCSMSRPPCGVLVKQLRVRVWLWCDVSTKKSHWLWKNRRFLWRTRRCRPFRVYECLCLFPSLSLYRHSSVPLNLLRHFFACKYIKTSNRRIWMYE